MNDLMVINLINLATNWRYDFKITGNQITSFDEVRNECWSCHNLFNLSNPELFEKGQKMYFVCNICGAKGNHL